MVDSIHLVVVVGAGPVGLTTALDLAQNGIRVLVLESGAEQVPAQWRGSTIHPPTLDIFNELGLAETIIAGAVKVETLQYRDLEIPIVANFSYGCLEDKVRYPFRLQFEQYKLLKMLRVASIEHPNIEIAYSTEVLSVIRETDKVLIEVVQDGKILTIQSQWLVGADGSHSVIRKGLDIGLDGFTYQHPTTVVATSFPFDKYIDDLAPVSYWSGPLGRLSMIKTPDVWRIAMTIQQKENDDLAGDSGSLLSPSNEFLQAIALLLKWIPGSDLADLKIQQYETYRSHQRIAREFAVGRVALAGDAAHLTSTNGGMGLNSGVQDAAALSGYLREAIKNQTTEPLHKYANEREAFCKDFLQPTTTENHQSVDSSNSEIRLDRLLTLQGQSKDNEATLKVVRRASMLLKL